VVAWERRGSRKAFSGAWRTASIGLDAFAGQVVRIRFEAADGGASSIVEAGIDVARDAVRGPGTAQGRARTTSRIDPATPSGA